MTELVAAARRWLAEDPDPDTRRELEGVLERGDEVALAERFGTRLAFGTAGLRGEMGAGPNRMNRATVRFAAAGLARHLAAKGVHAPDVPVVIGYDARHGSADFAADSARVIAGAGRRVVLLPRPLPTPVLAFAVRHLGAAAGVMVTASHNPARDNGYKVYAADGAQIIPPVDEEIAEAIASFMSLHEIPLADAADPSITIAGDELVESYVEDAAATLAAPLPAEVRVAYTPLHGVGRDVLERVFARAGVAPPAAVASQADPDPDFPTVSFPNPEEPGAMDAVIALAEDRDAHVALANDPDADRLAVAVRTGDGWRRLTGDEVGWLLADHLLRRAAPAGDDRRPLVATTVVSSRLLAHLATAHGAVYAETLTGFKWLARPAMADPTLRQVLAYEEALGYAVGERRDKDGITAALVFVELVATLVADGATVEGRLDEIAARFGAHVTGQLSLRREGPAGAVAIANMMSSLRKQPPSAIAARPVTLVRDLLAPSSADAHALPATDALVFEMGNSARVVVRPSGTEPKAKVYAEVVGVERTTAQDDLAAVLDDMRARLEEATA